MTSERGPGLRGAPVRFAERRRVGLLLIRDLLLNGHVVAGVLTADGGFAPWPLSPKESLARIEAEWLRRADDPNISDICWFDLPRHEQVRVLQGDPSPRPTDQLNGHLDEEGVIQQMLAACPKLKAVLDDDAEVSGGLPYLQVALIAKALARWVTLADEPCIRGVMSIAEDVLDNFGQEGRDFIGAGFVEGIPQGAESRLKRFAGPLTAQLVDHALGVQSDDSRLPET